MGAGLCWGLFCLLISGISEVLPPGGFVAGPVVLISCSLLGFLAWREEIVFLFRALLVFGGYALVVYLLGSAGAVDLHVRTVVPVVVLMGMLLVIMFFVDLYMS
jgi:hypothetical protein